MSISVLLVDDEPQQSARLTEALQRLDGAGVQLTQAAGLAEAVDALAGGAFDVILLDLTLADPSHLEPIRTMRREAPATPLIALIDDDSDLGFQSVQAGAQDYLVKGHTAGRPLLRIIRVAIERQRALNEAMALSFIDTLTGLHNRRGFLTLCEHQLRIARRSKRPMMVFFIDLDGLKVINDRLGHQHGDAAIAECAAVLRESFRDTDLLARLGGDEFAVLAIEAPDQTADVLRERLAGRVLAHNSEDRRDYDISMSVGLAHFNPEKPRPIEELLRQADKLMYREKSRKGAQRR